QVYNLDELRGRLNNMGRDTGSPCQLLLALFDELGDSFASLLNGEFNVLIYDRPARSVTVVNDRLAYRPFHYQHRAGVTLFALERKAILAACDAAPPIDRLALLELFAFGHHLEDRTLFEGVLAMPQGSVL